MGSLNTNNTAQTRPAPLNLPIGNNQPNNGLALGGLLRQPAPNPLSSPLSPGLNNGRISPFMNDSILNRRLR